MLIKNKQIQSVSPFLKYGKFLNLFIGGLCKDVGRKTYGGEGAMDKTKNSTIKTFSAYQYHV